MRFVTTAGATPICRAAAEKLPQLATAKNAFRFVSVSNALFLIVRDPRQVLPRRSSFSPNRREIRLQSSTWQGGSRWYGIKGER